MKAPYILEFDGDTKVAKATGDVGRYLRYPFQIVELEELTPTDQLYIVVTCFLFLQFIIIFQQLMFPNFTAHTYSDCIVHDWYIYVSGLFAFSFIRKAN